MFTFWSLLFFILKFGLMGAGAYFGVTLFYADVSIWLANYIEVPQTLTISTYATTIISGVIAGYIAYMIIGGLLKILFQGSMNSATENVVRKRMGKMQNNFFNR